MKYLTDLTLGWIRKLKCSDEEIIFDISSYRPKTTEPSTESFNKIATILISDQWESSQLMPISS